MAYSTLDDLAKLVSMRALIELTDDSGDYLQVDLANLAEAIDQADRDIDAYLGRIAAVPLDPVPELVANLSAKIAVWNLHVRKHIWSDVWRAEYEDCLHKLEGIAAGDLALGPDLGDPGGEASPAGGVSGRSRPQKFTDDVWSRF